MAWKESDSMSERLEFVKLASVEGANISQICDRFGVSRKTGYKWLRRWREESRNACESLADRSRRRRVAVQGQVRARVVIVLEVLRKNALEMSFVDHDHVIQAIPSYAFDDSFAVRVLPGRAWCGRDFFNTPTFDARRERAGVDSIAIMYQKTGRFVI